jgi:ATP-dependent Clp protease ATP-binding subunit ClpX
MLSILTDPKNAIVKQYQKLFLMEGINLQFDNEALEVIVEKAMKRKTGARALRGIVEEIMLPLMFELPDKTNINICKITKDYANGDGEPIFEYSDGSQIKSA